VAGFRYVLDTQKKIAHRTTVGPNSNPPRMIKNSAAPVPPAPPGTTGVLAAGAGFAGAIAPNTAEPELRPERSTESLGTQTINGVQARGTRFTTVYPVNSEGNDRPITVTNESWVSPQLNITVMSKNSDPRHGDRINRVENLTLSEPDPSLFQPPPDYQVVDETGTFRIDYSRQ